MTVAATATKLTRALNLRVMFLWLAFHRAPEREFSRMMLEVLDEAEFERALRETVCEMVEEIEDSL